MSLVSAAFPQRHGMWMYMIGDPEVSDEEIGAILVSRVTSEPDGLLRMDGGWHAKCIPHYADTYELPILSVALLFNEPTQVL